jgi:epoxyqueuosine reductase
LTIEHKGDIDKALRPLMGNWVYGCDVCQDVCPFQRFAAPSEEAAFYPPNLDHIAPKIVDLLALDDATFHQRYYGSPIYRIKRERLLRNACVAAANWGSMEAVSPLQTLLSDPSPLLRTHAAWSLRQIMGDDSRRFLQNALSRETDVHVREEIQSLLETGK